MDRRNAVIDGMLLTGATIGATEAIQAFNMQDLAAWPAPSVEDKCDENGQVVARVSIDTHGEHRPDVLDGSVNGHQFHAVVNPGVAFHSDYFPVGLTRLNKDLTSEITQTWIPMHKGERPDTKPVTLRAVGECAVTPTTTTTKPEQTTTTTKAKSTYPNVPPTLGTAQVLERPAPTTTTTTPEVSKQLPNTGSNENQPAIAGGALTAAVLGGVLIARTHRRRQNAKNLRVQYATENVVEHSPVTGE